jgi:hypothetical protein
MNPLEKAAKLHFGVTDDLSETGYILSDGTFLDFSGRHEAQGYVRKGDRFVIKRGDDFLRYHRYVDHRMLPETITDKLDYDESHASSAMLAFMWNTGAMRIMPGVGLAVTRMPTFESINAFMRGWKQAYQADPVIVDILHPEGYTQRVSQEIEDPDIEKLIEFLEAHFNSPSMGAAGAPLFSFFTTCVNWPLPVEDLDLMVEKSHEISRKAFLKYVNPEEMREMERGLGYSPSSHLTMASDPYVAYFKSTVRGCPVVYFVWSAQEYVFGDLACIMRT